MKAYLDHAATTPLHPKVLEKMLPFLKEEFGNPSSVHSFGKNTRVAIEEARETIAAFINADPGEIYFTSGGTEANNFIVRGIARAEFKETGRNKIISTKLEHSSVKDSVKELSFEGYPVDYLTPLPDTTSSPESIIPFLDDKTSLVSVININNETGAVNNLKLIRELIAGKNIFLHTDSVQAFGKIPIDVKGMGISALTASAHKIMGPKGIGIAFIASGTPVNPLILGGSQERKRRGGTENPALIAGFAEAVKIAGAAMKENFSYVSSLKSEMVKGINSIDNEGIEINNTHGSSPYILSVTFKSSFYRNDTEAMLMYLDINGVAASSGAACSSGTLKPSHVIIASGKTEGDAEGTFRFSFGPAGTMDEIHHALDVIKKMCGKFGRKS